MIKKFFNILIIVLICLNFNVEASTNTYDRETLPNYGVNKKWEINDTNINNVLNTYAVNASEKIYDFSDILTEGEEKKLKKIIDEFVIKYKTDVIILTENLSYMSDYENESFATDFYDYNDFGIDYNNSGILLFRNTYVNDPYYNMYVFGEAQLYMSSDRIEATLDNIYDYLHKKNYLAGFTKYVNDLNLYYRQGIPKTMENYKITESGYLKRKFIVPWFELISSALIVTTIIMYVLIKKNQMITKATKANRYINRTKSKLTNERDVFLSTSTRTYTIANANVVKVGGKMLSGGGSSYSGGSSGVSTRGSSGGGHRSGGGRHG